MHGPPGLLVVASEEVALHIRSILVRHFVGSGGNSSRGPLVVDVASPLGRVQRQRMQALGPPREHSSEHEEPGAGPPHIRAGSAGR